MACAHRSQSPNSATAAGHQPRQSSLERKLDRWRNNDSMRISGRKAQALAMDDVARGQFERARARLLWDFRHGGDVDSLLLLASLELDAGLIGIAAAHFARASLVGIPRRLDMRAACEAWLVRAEAAANIGEFLAADEDVRRVARHCPMLGPAHFGTPADWTRHRERLRSAAVDQRIGLQTALDSTPDTDTDTGPLPIEAPPVRGSSEPTWHRLADEALGHAGPWFLPARDWRAVRSGFSSAPEGQGLPAGLPTQVRPWLAQYAALRSSTPIVSLQSPQPTRPEIAVPVDAPLELRWRWAVLAGQLELAAELVEGQTSVPVTSRALLAVHMGRHQAAVDLDWQTSPAPARNPDGAHHAIVAAALAALAAGRPDVAQLWTIRLETAAPQHPIIAELGRASAILQSWLAHQRNSTSAPARQQRVPREAHHDPGHEYDRACPSALSVFDPESPTELSTAIAALATQPELIVDAAFAQRLVEISEADPTLGCVARWTIPLLDRGRHEPLLRAMLTRWLHAPEQRQSRTLEALTQMAASLGEVRRAEMLAIRSAAHALSPLAQWLRLAEIGRFYGVRLLELRAQSEVRLHAKAGTPAHRQATRAMLALRVADLAADPYLREGAEPATESLLWFFERHLAQLPSAMRDNERALILEAAQARKPESSEAIAELFGHGIVGNPLSTPRPAREHALGPLFFGSAPPQLSLLAALLPDASAPELRRKRLRSIASGWPRFDSANPGTRVAQFLPSELQLAELLSAEGG